MVAFLSMLGSNQSLKLGRAINNVRSATHTGSMFRQFRLHSRQANLIERETRLWVKNIVYGLRLCPWSGMVMDDMKVQVLDGDDMSSNIERIVREAERLDDVNMKDQTTLIVLSNEIFSSFENFLLCVEDVEEMLSESGFRCQLATFHPLYTFQDSEAEEIDVTDYTNRSPYPTLHLLRYDDVHSAIQSYSEVHGSGEDADAPATSRIWKNNKETLKKLGLEKAAQMLESIKAEAAQEN